ncbi:myosin-16-like [Branchiostoma lanceolatum]|uniref:myosin-16-like n=1 Tax=Branchiostoma lanceolatum TaxID=7740 RepID=UPI0034528271
MPAYGPSLEDQPSERFLFGDPEDMKKLRSAPYDAKKNCWVPDEKEVFIEAEIKAKKGDQVTVTTRLGNTFTVKESVIQEMNPPKFACAEDMANMTYLNEASVMNNLRTRYQNTLIYTYSGLFCVVINPFRRLPIYGANVVATFHGKRRQEVPPHLFSVADEAYMNMIGDQICQSILITGESGAGKTENTKKVLSYFASVGASQAAAAAPEGAEQKATLEDQIVQTNPVLEAFGNAKTVRNNNSSRFGKFIRVQFNRKGVLAGGDIETYLLEKSRVISQLPGMERGYHIFFQLMSNGIPGTVERMLLRSDPAYYRFVTEGVYEVANLDDGEEFRLTDDAFDILNFAASDKEDIYKLCAAILWFGNAKFAQRGEQGEIEGFEEMDKTSRLLGVDREEFVNAICKPRVKVGSEFVTKGQTAEQCMNSVGALSKSIYDRVFKFIVAKCNETLETDMERAFFVGVLDIAGFEIFELNSFEQLCINYTNEKLQQFFNHHMFVNEQEEYKQEQIDWEFVDFGMDLQACLDLIEKPLGILSMLEEECIVPKATDNTYLDKLQCQHLGKNPKFGKPKPGKKKYEAHFQLGHYAGPVGYNVGHWLEKNKDPVNETAVKVFKGAANDLLKRIWADYITAEEQAGQKGGKKKKGGSFMTVSAVHREQLNHLMHTLHQTYPHFVRCLIPNELKTGGIIDGPLVYNQLTCNGVLEGIRICQKGFPNRQIFSDFIERYRILAAEVFADGTFMEGKEASRLLLEATGLPKNRYAIGLTKVFFKAGTLGMLEEMREDKINAVLIAIQSRYRARTQRVMFEKLYNGRMSVDTIQRNIRMFFNLRHDGWYKMYGWMKPQLTGAKAEELLKDKEIEVENLKKEFAAKQKKRTELQATINDLLAEKEDIVNLLGSEGSVVREAAEERVRTLTKEFEELDVQYKEMEESWTDLNETNRDLEIGRDRALKSRDELKSAVEEMEARLSEHENAKQGEDSVLREKEEQVAQNAAKIEHLTNEKARLEDLNAQTLEDLAAEEEKASELSKVKIRLEQTMDDLEDNLGHERRIVTEVERVKSRLERDLKAVQDKIAEIEALREQLTDTLKQKEQEALTATTGMEDEAGAASSLQKKIREFTRLAEDIEDDIDVERSARVKAERARTELQRQLEDMTEKLDESSGLSNAQIEKNKRREQELARVRRDLEDTLAAQEAEASGLRKKHADLLAEMTETLDHLAKGKTKVEKDRNRLRLEIEDLNVAFDAISKQKAQFEKLNKQLELAYIETTVKIEEHSHAISELNSAKNRLAAENGELLRQLEESESSKGGLNRQVTALTAQVEEVKRALDEELAAKGQAFAQLRAAQAELASLQEQLEEEQETRGELQRQLAKANSELSSIKAKYETDATQRMEELEEVRRKLTIALAEAEEQVESATAKCSSLEKTRNRLAAEVEDLQVDVEKAHSMCQQLEKKQYLYDRQLEEWRSKCEVVAVELEKSQKESRESQSEILKVKGVLEEAQDALEHQKKENRFQQAEIHDLQDQLSGNAKVVAELEKGKRRLEVEIEELHGSLEETENALELEQGKVVRVQMEFAQLKSDIDRRLAEKDEEFESTLKLHQRALDTMNQSIDLESKARLEAERINTSLAQQLSELETALENANKANQESRKLLGSLHQTMQELQIKLDEEQRIREDLKDQIAIKERYCNSMASEIETLRSQLDEVDRIRKIAEVQLAEANDRLNELTTQNSGLVAQRRKLEGDIHTIQSELEEQVSSQRQAEEKAKRAISDAARLAEDLRAEQEAAQHALKVQATMEANLKDLQRRIEEAEQAAIKGGRRAIQKLEGRVRELELDIEAAQKKHQEDLKGLRKNDRRLKELTFSSEEDRKNQERLQELIEKLQMKIRALKRQVEETEASASQSQSKFRHCQHELDDALERLEIAESALVKLRHKTETVTTVTRGPGGSVVRRTVTRRTETPE